MFAVIAAAGACLTAAPPDRSRDRLEQAREDPVVPKGIPTRLPEGSLVARFEIPRLGLVYDLLEGTSNRTLDRSIGRVAGTGMVGGTGNIGIAGHRNTHFRKLEWIRLGDVIALHARGVAYRYVVSGVELVTPESVEVLDQSLGPALTLVTCFPFEYVGAAPLRYIVRALPDEETQARLRPEANAAHSSGGND